MTEVIVDKRPRSCFNCPCVDMGRGVCKLTGKPYVMPYCSMKLTSDHDAKIRNQICDKIRKSLDDKVYTVMGCRGVPDNNYVQYKSVVEVLDEIERGVNG